MDNCFLAICPSFPLWESRDSTPQLSSVAIALRHSGTVPDTQSGHAPKLSGIIPDSLSGQLPDSPSAFIPDSVSGIIPDWVSGLSRITHWLVLWSLYSYLLRF
jgi:hypothetical protein